jgi:hypothetical protein
LSKRCGGWDYKGNKSFIAHNVKDYEWGEHEVLKGGHEHILWNLRQFAEHGTARKVVRERQTGLRKRRVESDGTTAPLIVNN